MSVLTQSGRAAIAASIREQPIHLAWGTGDSSSGSSHQVEKVFVEGEIALDHHTIKDVRVFTGQTTYQPSIDYIVDSSSGVIKRTENSSIRANSAVIAFLIIVQTGHRKAESTARRKDSNRGLALFFIANQ